MTLAKAQIGKCGELLVQYMLLLQGVESAPMSTDTGVDLVDYSAQRARPTTIQIKSNLKPKPGGGKGKLALDWWIDEDTPAEYVALVDLSSQRVWIFSKDELNALLLQKSNGRFHLYMYTDPTVRLKKAGRSAFWHEFEKYLLEKRVHEIFGV